MLSLILTPFIAQSSVSSGTPVTNVSLTILGLAIALSTYLSIANLRDLRSTLLKQEK